MNSALMPTTVLPPLSLPCSTARFAGCRVLACSVTVCGLESNCTLVQVCNSFAESIGRPSAVGPTDLRPESSLRTVAPAHRLPCQATAGGARALQISCGYRVPWQALASDLGCRGKRNCILAQVCNSLSGRIGYSPWHIHRDN